VEREISIVSGGDLVALNGFVKKMFLNTLLGMLSSLHDVDLDGEVRIVVSAKEPTPGAR